MASLEDFVGVVIDAGSYDLKAGFSGEHFPRTIEPTTVAQFRCDGLIDGFKSFSFGKEAISRRGVANLTWPVKDGQIEDWESMEKLWHHIFYSALMTPPETSKVLHSVHPLVEKGARERMAEIFFESFAIQGLNLQKSPVLALYACGKTTGVVYENGHSSSYALPVYEGFPIVHAGMSSPLTGNAISEQFQKLLFEVGYSFTTPKERDIIEAMKMAICYVAQNYDFEMQKATESQSTETSYTLPDGQIIHMTKENFLAPEILFQPNLASLDCPNIVDLICTSIEICDLDVKKRFFSNIVVSGGSTMFPGLVNRLMSEMTPKVKIKHNVKPAVQDLPSRNLAVWTGGSIVASLPCLKGFWMTKGEYEDFGPDRVNYKFM